MELTEKEIYRISELLYGKLKKIKSHLQVINGMDSLQDYYIHLIEEQAATEKLFKKFQDELTKKR